MECHEKQRMYSIHSTLLQSRFMSGAILGAENIMVDKSQNSWPSRVYVLVGDASLYVPIEHDLCDLLFPEKINT